MPQPRPKETWREELRRTVRALVLTGLAFAVPFGALWIWGFFREANSRVAELKGFRAGIPATMLPEDRRYFEEPIRYKGQKMTGRYYKSTVSGTAANSDYFVIINGDGIVEAAFSTDDPRGRDWYEKHRSEER